METTTEPKTDVAEAPARGGGGCAAVTGSPLEERRFNHSRWESIGDLMVDLMRDMTPRPFWIEFGRYATKVTNENKDSLAHGLHLALEFQMARDEESA